MKRRKSVLCADIIKRSLKQCTCASTIDLIKVNNSTTSTNVQQQIFRANGKRTVALAEDDAAVTSYLRTNECYGMRYISRMGRKLQNTLRRNGESTT